MTTTRHTLGNWQAFRCFADNAPDYWLVSTKAFKGEKIATCEKEADARLIAAAPILLAQCKRAQDELASAIRDGNGHFDPAMVKAWYKGVNAAIEAAEKGI